jgi:hypothetical protein
MNWIDIPDKTLDELANKNPQDFSHEDIFTLGVYMLSRFGKPMILTGESRDCYDALSIYYLDLNKLSYQIHTTIPLLGSTHDIERFDLSKSGVNVSDDRKVFYWARDLLEKPDILDISITLRDFKDGRYGNEVFFDSIDPQWTANQQTPGRLYAGELPYEKVFQKGPWLDELANTYKRFYDSLKEK